MTNKEIYFKDCGDVSTSTLAYHIQIYALNPCKYCEYRNSLKRMSGKCKTLDFCQQGIYNWLEQGCIEPDRKFLDECNRVRTILKRETAQEEVNKEETLTIANTPPQFICYSCYFVCYSHEEFGVLKIENIFIDIESKHSVNDIDFETLTNKDINDLNEQLISIHGQSVRIINIIPVRKI